MKALMIRGPRDLHIEDVPDPELTDDTAILRTQLSVIVRTSVMEWEGSDPRTRAESPTNPLFRGLPYILAGESVGEVVAVGSKVDSLKVGDRVAASWRYAERHRISSAASGGWVKLSANVDAESGISLVWGATTLHVVRRAQITLGDNVVIVGQGPLGLQVTRWVAMTGAEQVIAVERVGSRLALSKRFGATSVLNPDEVDVHKGVLEMTGGRGADVVINATTSAAAFEFCLRLARKKGRVAVLSWHTQPITIHDLTHDFYTKELEIIGSEAHGPPDELQSPWVRWTRGENMRYVERMMAAGKFDTKPLITHRFAVEKVEEALRLVDEHPDQVLKAVLVW